MSHESNQFWFIRRVVTDATLIGFCTWFVLFAIELIKPGLVSFYLSLPQALFALVCLAVLSLSLQPPRVQPAYVKANKRLLTALSLAATLVICLATGWHGWLTLLLILVTVASIWASADLFSQP